MQFLFDKLSNLAITITRTIERSGSFESRRLIKDAIQAWTEKQKAQTALAHERNRQVRRHLAL